MPTQAFPYLAITDGTTLIIISDGNGGATSNNYPLVRGQWAPQVAGLRNDPLSGRSPYNDVEETFVINVRGATASDCYANLEALTRLLDKAERWWKNRERIASTNVLFTPQGSTITSNSNKWVGKVLGRAAPDDVAGIALPKNTADAGMIYEIDNVTIRLLRRGLWVQQTLDQATITSAGGNPGIQTISWNSINNAPSYARLDISGFDSTATPTIAAGFLVVAANVNFLRQFVAQSGTATGYTAFNDSTKLPALGNNNVLRYTPTGTAPANSGSITLPGAMWDRIAILVALRNNSATTTFTVQINLFSSGQLMATTQGIYIDTSTLNPRIVSFGTVSVYAVDAITFTITASAASGTLDIDYVTMVILQDETSAVVAHDAIPLTGGGGATTMTFDYDANTNTSQAWDPTVSANSPPANYRGQMPLMTVLNFMYVAWLATNGIYWRFTNTSNAAINIQVKGYRYMGAIIPQ